MTTAGRATSMRYLIATLAQIARTLNDFGFRDESTALERISRELQTKLHTLNIEKVDRI